MENNIATLGQNNAPVAVKPSMVAAAGSMAMALMPRDFDQFWRLSTIMAASGMVPKAYLNKPEACFIAMQMGAETGLTPMQSIQSIAVINGMPSIWVMLRSHWFDNLA